MAQVYCVLCFFCAMLLLLLLDALLALALTSTVLTLYRFTSEFDRRSCSFACGMLACLAPAFQQYAGAGTRSTKSWHASEKEAKNHLFLILTSPSFSTSLHRSITALYRSCNHAPLACCAHNNNLLYGQTEGPIRKNHPTRLTLCQYHISCRDHDHRLCVA